MCARTIGWVAAVISLLWPHVGVAENVLFEDNFDDGLSDQWQLVGIQDQDIRIRDGGLELRVQPSKLTPDTPMLKVILPFTSADTLIASVEITLIDRFTEPSEFAALYLFDDTGLEFGARKQRLDGFLVFSPGNVKFIGPPGEEGDPTQYALKYWPARNESGPLRIIVRDQYASFQVGPSSRGEYLNFLSSAIRKDAKERGFSLVAAGGPNDGAHWVRFDNLRVWKP